MGKGLQTLLKMYGEMKMYDTKGNSITHVWDYANDIPRIKEEMTEQEIKASEKAKWVIGKA